MKMYKRETILRARYQKFNISCQKTYVLQLGCGVGFCAEMVGLLKAVQVCAQADSQLSLGQNPHPKGYAVRDAWTDYFEPVFPQRKGRWLGALNTSYARFDKVPLFRHSRRLALQLLYDANGYAIEKAPKETKEWTDWAREIGLAENWWEGQAQLVKALWIYNRDVREKIQKLLRSIPILADGFIGMHIRRGDKHSESPFTSIAKYAEVLQSGSYRDMPIFLATDNTRTADELRSAMGANQEVFLFPSAVRQGHFQESFNMEDPKIRTAKTIEFLSELEVLSGAALFIGASPSNVFFWTRYRRGNKAVIDVNELSRKMSL
jgi:hypothetical protein